MPKLAVQHLEARETPAAYTWTGLSGDGLWETPGNWETPVWGGDGVPGMRVNGYPDDLGDSAVVGFGEVLWGDDDGECGTVNCSGGNIDVTGRVRTHEITVSAGDMAFLGAGAIANYLTVTGGAASVRADLYVYQQTTLSGGYLDLFSAVLDTPVMLATGGRLGAHGSSHVQGHLVLGGATLEIGFGAPPPNTGGDVLTVDSFRCDGGTIKFRAGRVDSVNFADRLVVTGQADFAAAPTWVSTLYGTAPTVPQTLLSAGSWLGTSFGLGGCGNGLTLAQAGTTLTVS